MAFGIADTLTDIICEGIEKGTVAAETMIQSLGSVLGQIAGAIPDPIAKAIVGAVGVAATIGGRIISSLNKKVEVDVKKYNEEAKEAEKKRLGEIASIAGGITADIAKKIYGVNKQHLNWSQIFDTESLAMEKKKIDKFLKEIDTAKTTETRDEKKKREVTKGEIANRTSWGKFKRIATGIASLGLTELFHYQRKEEEEYTEKVEMEVQEVIAKMQEAKRKGNHAEAERLKKVIDETMREEAKKRDVDLDKIDGISNYVQGLDAALAAYIKNKDMAAFKAALKKSLYEAIVQKAVFNSALK